MSRFVRKSAWFHIYGGTNFLRHWYREKSPMKHAGLAIALCFDNYEAFELMRDDETLVWC